MFNYFKNIDDYLKYNPESKLTENLNTLIAYKEKFKIETTHTKYIGDIIHLLTQIINEKKIDETNYSTRLEELITSLQNKIKKTDTQPKINYPLSDGYRDEQ